MQEREPAARRVSVDERNVISWRVPNDVPSNIARESNVAAGDPTDAAVPDISTTTGPEQSQFVGKEDVGSEDAQPKNGSSGSSSGGGGTSGRGSKSDGGRGGESEGGVGSGGARLWAYLFRNVNRAVDELYYLCDAEESVEQCQEAAQLLELCGRDFSKLVERIQDQRRFELEQEEDTTAAAAAAVAAAAAGGDVAGLAEASSCPRGDSAGSASGEAAAPRQAMIAEGGGAGDSTLGSRHQQRPKAKGGLSWEVRKNTPVTCGGAGSIIMTAIGRMGQGQGHPQPQAQGTTAVAGDGTQEVATAATLPAAAAASVASVPAAAMQAVMSAATVGDFEASEQATAAASTQQALLAPVPAALAGAARQTIDPGATIAAAVELPHVEGEAAATPRRALRAAAKPFYPSFAASMVAAVSTANAATASAAAAEQPAAVATATAKSTAGKAAVSAEQPKKVTGSPANVPRASKKGRRAVTAANATPELSSKTGAAAVAAAAKSGNSSSVAAAKATASKPSAVQAAEHVSGGKPAVIVSTVTATPAPPAAALPKASPTKTGTEGAEQTVPAAAAAAPAAVILAAVAGKATVPKTPAAAPPVAAAAAAEAAELAPAAEPQQSIYEKAAEAAAAAAADAAAEADEEADYAAATERIWAEAEAWVEAEAAAEDEAWAALSREGAAAAGDNRGGASAGSSRGVGFRTAGGSVRLSDLSLPEERLGSGGRGVAAGNFSLRGNSSLEISIPELPHAGAADGCEPLLLLQQPRRRFATAAASSAANSGLDVVEDDLDALPLPPRRPLLPPKPLSAPAQLPPGVAAARRSNWGVAALLAAQGDVLQSSWGSSGSFSDFETIGGPLTDPLGSSGGGRGGVAALLDDYFGVSEQFQPSTGDSASAADGFASDCGVGGSGPRLRNLHRKFSSPDRKRPTPAEAKRRHDRRQSMAAMNRAQLAHGLRQKLQLQSDRARVVSERQAQRLAEREKGFQDRLHQADARRVAHRQGIVRKASDENNKVDEVLFINKLTVEDLNITLQMRLQEVERKIESGRERRLQHLTGISARQKLRRKERVEQMTERRFELEKAASERWSKLEARLETVQERRAARIQELRRRREETAELQARAAVRREARCEEIASRAKEKEVRREQASVKREQILSRPGSLSALGGDGSGAGSGVEDAAATAAARDALFAAIRAGSSGADDVTGSGGGSGAERRHRRREQAGERRKGAADSDNDDDAALDAALAAARAESQSLLARARAAAAAAAADNRKTGQGEAEAAAARASHRRRVKKARQRLSRLSKECPSWFEVAAGADSGEASAGKPRPLASRLERLLAQLASALPQTQAGEWGGGGGGNTEGTLVDNGCLIGEAAVTVAISATRAGEQLSAMVSTEVDSDGGGGGGGGGGKRRKKKRRPKHDEPGCLAAPMASLGGFPAVDAGKGDMAAAAKPSNGADKLESTLRELQRLAKTARRDGDLAALRQGGALPLLVRAAALAGSSCGGGGGSGREQQRRQAENLALSLSCLSVALADSASRSFVLSADLAAPLVNVAAALMSEALIGVRQASDRPLSSSAPSQQAASVGVPTLPLQPSNRRQGAGGRRDGGGSGRAGSSSTAAAAAAANPPASAGAPMSAVVDPELAGSLSSAMLVVLQLVWPLAPLPSPTGPALPATAASETAPPVSGAVSPVSGTVSTVSGAVSAVSVVSEPLLRVQDELLKYLLLSGLLRDGCALLEALHARAEEVLGDSNAWVLVTMVFRLIDAVASFPFAKETISGSSPLQQPCHEVAELSSGTFGGRAVPTVLSGVQEASGIAAPVSLLAALVLAEEAKDDAAVTAVTSVTSGSAVSAVSAAASGERGGGPSDRVLALASIAMHALNQLSKLDLDMVQTTLAAPEVRPEFTYVCDRLLKRFSVLVAGILRRRDGGGGNGNAGGDAGGSGASGTAEELEACFGELVALLGYFTLASPANQEMMQWGAPPTLLTRLCTLPFSYFADERRRGVLLPTLVSACLHNAGNRAAAEQHVAAAFLAEYVEGHRRAMLADQEAAHETEGGTVNAKTHAKEERQEQTLPPPPWMQLSLRLPIGLWEEAVTFFG